MYTYLVRIYDKPGLVILLLYQVYTYVHRPPRWTTVVIALECYEYYL